MEKMQSRFVDVEVVVDGRNYRAPDKEVQVGTANQPDSIRWIFKEFPEGATHVMIKWELDSPFVHLGAGKAELWGAEAVLLGTGPTGETGMFRYSILFCADDGTVVGGIDPWIKFLPPPPFETH